MTCWSMASLPRYRNAWMTKGEMEFSSPPKSLGRGCLENQRPRSHRERLGAVDAIGQVNKFGWNLGADPKEIGGMCAAGNDSPSEAPRNRLCDRINVRAKVGVEKGAVPRHIVKPPSQSSDGALLNQRFECDINHATLGNIQKILRREDRTLI